MRRVLGVDPGSQKTGFCIIGTNSEVLSSGTIVLDPKVELATRLHELHTDLISLIQKYTATELALETSFFSKNAQSAFKLGQVRGVIMAASASQQVPVSEYSPTEVKLSVSGSGRADKEQVEHMMRIYLKLPKSFEFSSPDESDAMALCLTHLQKNQNPNWRPDDRNSKRQAATKESH